MYSSARYSASEYTRILRFASVDIGQCVFGKINSSSSDEDPKNHSTYRFTVVKSMQNKFVSLVEHRVPPNAEEAFSRWVMVKVWAGRNFLGRLRSGRVYSYGGVVLIDLQLSNRW